MTGDKFTHELHLRQPGFTYNACGLFLKHYKRIQKFKEKGDLNYIYKNTLHKACFVYNSPYTLKQSFQERTQSLRKGDLHQTELKDQLKKYSVLEFLFLNVTNDEEFVSETKY